MKTILILAGVPYDHLKQRPQHFASFFAKQGYEVLYLSITDNTKIHPNSFKDINNIVELKKELFQKNVDNVFILKNSIAKVSLEGISLTGLMDKLCDLYVNDNLTYIVSFPAWVTYIPKVPDNTKIIYDCLDDWESFLADLDMGHKEDLLYNERKIASIADLVIASSKRLYIKMSYLNNNLLYLPNGVWNEDYENVKGSNKRPPELMTINQPIVFFMGAIAEWVDIELISHVAKSRPQYSFVFVGPGRCKLPQLPNIYYLGIKNYDELPKYLEYSRVSIIPFKVNNLTAAVTPLKFYEYLSSGTPVINTIMPDIIDLNGSKTAVNKNEFIGFLDYYINMDEDKYKIEISNAKTTAMSFDWGQLLKPITSFIDENNFNTETKEVFINEMIRSYIRYEQNELMKNELLNAYNLLGKYANSLSLFKSDSEENLSKIDYEKLALAHIKLNNIDEAILLLRKYANKSEKLLLNYINSLLTESSYEILLEIYLLKISGNTYEALQLIDKQVPLRPKLIGMLTGLYLDIGEYEIAFQYAMRLLDNLNGCKIEEIFDVYSITFLIRSLAERMQYKLAEEIALNLLEIDKYWEVKGIELLSDLYVSMHIA